MRLAKGVMDGPILPVKKVGVQYGSLAERGTWLETVLTHPTAPAVSALMTVALFA